MRHSLLCGALLFGLAALAAAEPPDGGVKTIQPPPGPAVPPPEPAPVIPLAVKPGRAEDCALKYTLLPDPLDQTPGNAAPLWVLAGDSASAVAARTARGAEQGRRPRGHAPQPRE